MSYHPKRNPPLQLMILMSLLTLGCDDRATRIAIEAADRQARQNSAMAELSREVASGSRSLVAADAAARKEIVGVHRDLQNERQRLDDHRESLEQDRRSTAAARKRESLLVPAIQYAGSALVVALMLAFCHRALAAAHREEATLADVNELLLEELAKEHGRSASCFGQLLTGPRDSQAQLPNKPE